MVNIIAGFITFIIILILYVIIIKTTLLDLIKISKESGNNKYLINKHKYLNNVRLMKVGMYLISGLLTYSSIVLDVEIPLVIILIVISTLEGIDNLIQFIIDRKYGC